MEKRPNILLILTDQQRFDSLGAYGFRGRSTPHIDGLAREGVTFERCYANSPLCTPSRASLWTGSEVPGHGVFRLYDVLPDDRVLITEHLRAAGYQTALVGKLHVSSLHEEAERRHPHDGFERYEWCVESAVRLDSPYHAYGAWLRERDPTFYERLRREGRALTHHPQHLHFNRWAAERSIAFLRERDPNQPFFLAMSVFDPHNPYDQFPREMTERLDEGAIPPPVLTDGVPGEASAVRRERHGGYMRDFAALDDGDLREMRRGYHASLAFLDQEVGSVLATLAEEGLAEETLVVFTSDHGDMLGDHGLLVKGAFFYDPSVRVPLIMRWPGRLPAGLRARGLVQLHDLAATFLDAAGYAVEDREAIVPEAASLLPMAAGQAARVRSEAVCVYRNSGISRDGYWDPPIDATMLADERYKLTLYHPAGGEIEGEIYDLELDPSESRNLWSRPEGAEPRRRLTEGLLAWLARQEGRLRSPGERLPAPGFRLNNVFRKAP